MEIKTIELKVGQSFWANGVEYVPTKTLSIERYVRASILVQEIGKGLYGSQDDEIKALSHIFDQANKGNLAEVAVLAHNRITQLKASTNIGHPILRLCAQYINRKDEDSTIITEEDELAKIGDWAREGLSFESFFTFGSPLVSPILDKFKQHIEDTLIQKRRLEQIVEEISSLGGQILVETEKKQLSKKRN